MAPRTLMILNLLHSPNHAVVAITIMVLFSLAILALIFWAGFWANISHEVTLRRPWLLPFVILGAMFPIIFLAGWFLGGIK